MKQSLNAVLVCNESNLFPGSQEVYSNPSLMDWTGDSQAAGEGTVDNQRQEGEFIQLPEIMVLSRVLQCILSEQLYLRCLFCRLRMFSGSPVHCSNGSIFLPVPVPDLERTQNIWCFRVRFQNCLIFSAGSGSGSVNLLLTVPILRNFFVLIL